MASCFAHPMEISRDDYNDIFGRSDEEIGNKEVSEVEDKSDENDETGSNSEGDEPVEWTDGLHNIHVDNLTLPLYVV